jgi:hypothetical protein
MLLLQLLLFALLCVATSVAKNNNNTCGKPNFGKASKHFTINGNQWSPLWITECVLKEAEDKGYNRTIMRIPHRYPHIVPDFDGQLPGKVNQNGDDDHSGKFVFHAWNNLIPAFGHKELTVNDCNDNLKYFMKEYDYHFLSWDVNLQICTSKTKCEGSNIIGYSRKAGVFNRDIVIYPADKNGKMKKDPIIFMNKTFWLFDWDPLWDIKLKGEPGTDKVLDPIIITAIVSNRIFAQIGSGWSMQFLIAGWTIIILILISLICCFICCRGIFPCECCQKDCCNDDGDYGSGKYENVGGHNI